MPHNDTPIPGCTPTTSAAIIAAAAAALQAPLPACSSYPSSSIAISPRSLPCSCPCTITTITTPTAAAAADAPAGDGASVGRPVVEPKQLAAEGGEGWGLRGRASEQVCVCVQVWYV